MDVSINDTSTTSFFEVTHGYTHGNISICMYMYSLVVIELIELENSPHESRWIPHS